MAPRHSRASRSGRSSNPTDTLNTSRNAQWRSTLVTLRRNEPQRVMSGLLTMTKTLRVARPTFRLTHAKRRILELLAEYFCLRTKDVAELLRGHRPNDNDL